MSFFRTEKRNTVIVVFLAVLLSVYPALLMNSAKQNMLLLGVMAISPIAIFLSQKILITARRAANAWGRRMRREDGLPFLFKSCMPDAFPKFRLRFFRIYCLLLHLKY